MIFVIVGLITHQKGLFLPEAVLAGECKESSFTSSDKQVHLIELYTSEGCSSCPPADKWISSLRNNKELGKTFVPIKFHVDYWNYLGWKDQLSSVNYSNRQRLYASEWQARNVYTPGFVLDGVEWRGWRTFNPPNASEKTVGILKAIKELNSFKVEFSAAVEQKMRLNFAILGNGIEHKIKSGENSGKTLKHNFSVLHYDSMVFKNKMSVNIPKTEINAPEKMIVFWLDLEKSQKPIQVVSGCIN